MIIQTSSPAPHLVSKTTAKHVKSSTNSTVAGNHDKNGIKRGKGEGATEKVYLLCY